MAVYVLATLWLFHRLGIVDRTHLPGCACGDQVDQVWFLALAHSSVVGGHLPFFTTRIDYPGGVNVLDNASLPLLGAMASPITALLGPVGAFALLVRLSFVLSAASAFFVLRRLVRSDLAAALGGAFYGFSPYMTHQGANHMFLAFVPLPPIMLLLVYERLSSPSRRALTGGLLLGALAVVQYFISSEILVSTALIAVLAMVALATRELVSRRPIGVQVRNALRMGAGSALVAVPVLTYPAWYALAGPGHVNGPTQLATAPGLSLMATILPADRRLIAGVWPGWKIAPIQFLGDTAYLGLPLILVCACVAVTCRRSGVVRASVAVGAVAWILSLGTRLVWHNRVTHLPLPFALLTHLPVLQDLVSARLTFYVDLAAAALLAVGADRLRSHVRAHATRSSIAVAAIAMATIAAGTAFTLPWVSYPVASTGVAGAFAGGAVDRAIPAGAVVLSYPYPVYPEDDAMLWQAEDGLRFSLLGGYAVRPLGTQGVKTPPLLYPLAIQKLLLGAWPDPQLTGATGTTLAAAQEALPGFVRRYHVSLLLVEQTGRDPGRVIAVFRAVYGPPRHFGRIDLWDRLAPRPGPAFANGGAGARLAEEREGHGPGHVRPHWQGGGAGRA